MKRVGSKAAVIDAEKRLVEARMYFYKVFQREFPAGSDMYFWYGNSMRKVTIIEWYPGSERVRVVGATRRPYMMNATALLGT